MFNKFKTCLFSLLFFCSFFCYSQINVATLTGPSSVPFAFFAEKINSEQTQNLDEVVEIDEDVEKTSEKEPEKSFNVEFCSSLDILMKSLKNQTVDICAVPVVILPEILNYLDFSYSCIGVFETSSFYVLSSDKKVKSFSDFLGKNINVYGNNSVSYNFLCWVLTQNEIPLTTSAGGIFVSVLNSRENIVSSLITRKNYSAILCEPDVTVALNKNKSLRKVIDMQKEYSAIKGNDFVLPVNVVIAKNDFIKSNKEALSEFENDFSQVILNVYTKPLQIQFLAKKYNLGISDKVIIDAIKNMNFEYINSNYEGMLLDSIQILNKKSYEQIKNRNDIFSSH